MRSTAVKIVILLIVLGGAWQAFRYRTYIETRLWHARHGTALTVGDYVIPVPRDWYVDSEGNGIYLLLRLDSEDRTAVRKTKWPASIMLLPQRPMKAEDLKRMLALVVDRRKEMGEDYIPQQTFSLGDETIYCTGGGKMPSPPTVPDIFDVQPFSWSCSSPGGMYLTVGGVDSDLKQAWEIVSHIRKRS